MILLVERFLHQPDYFTGFGVAVGLELGIDQFIANSNLEFTAIRRNQHEIPNAVFKIFQ